AAAKKHAEEVAKAKALAAARKAAALAKKKAEAAARAKLVAQQKHAEEVAQSQLAAAEKRDQGYRFRASAAGSFGATASMAAPPLAGTPSEASSASPASPIPLFAAIGAALALVLAGGYAVRVRLVQ